MTVNDGDILRIAVRQTGATGNDLVNVYHADVTAGAPATNADALTDIRDWIDSAYSSMNAVIHGSVNPLDIKVDKVQLVGGIIQLIENIGTISWGTLYNPAGSGDPLPSGVAGLVLLRTLVGKVFGKKFIPGMIEPQINGDTLQSTVLSALAAYALDFVVTYVGSAISLDGGILSTRTNQFEYFVEADVSSIPAYQRRRRPGTGS